MITLNGKGVFSAIAIGRIRYFTFHQEQIEKYNVEDIEKEIGRFHAAVRQETAELETLFKKAVEEVGEKDARIFQIHQMMLEDEDFFRSVEEIIRTEKINAEYAVHQAASAAEQVLAGSQDEYLRSRASDIREVFSGLVKILSGAAAQEIQSDQPVILAADDLTPGETIKLDKSKILAFITAKGSLNSHTAILARSMGIPAVVAVGESLNPDCNGRQAVVDGASGTIYLDPDAETLRVYGKAKAEQLETASELQQLKGKENITKDGRKIKIYANVGSLSDVETALENDAGGIGLFRSEFIYLGRSDFPAEEEQFQIYKTAVEKMEGKEVIIRTLDIGADKQVDYFQMPKEENPAMGCRAIRICLTRPEIFRTQLRALYRASVYGNLAIMFPMITSVEEVRDCKKIVQEVQNDLLAEGLVFRPDVKTGIMVETPAAALVSDELAAEVDFFSIGTNDLTQYTLAVDRQNPNLERFYHPHHSAVLKLIQMTAESAHRHGIQVGICGELGADSELTQTFLDFGIDELSVSASRILPLRKTVRAIDRECL
ncbi:phosphoenolpyruvate--protein phosphotransferase [Clostridium sp. KNHs216]|uniref:phosphoenolpyruvate--protein phosphotransferase n=1 Tax=Clostridium sp. KNHs216 TaxID=1550235 RepID=UPI00115350A6|nr:phosphoenolpyruvate--protein phosphotransferase [Clostridium sp. KNHs216]TQI68829.1 phosphotransferase system enzyme I (PtsI) [Clostridium sp. KNHs216]